MAFWVTGTDERDWFEKVGPTAQLLYIEAGAWAMDQVYKKRVELPDEWFIPDSVVRAWGKRAAAKQLVEREIWADAHRDGKKGFTYRKIRWENTPQALRQHREGDRAAQRQRRSPKRVVRPDKA